MAPSDLTHTSDDHDRIEAEARDWVLESPAGAEAKAAWRAADPRHEQAYRDAALAWAALGRTATARDAAWRREAAGLQRGAMLRRWAPAAAAAASVAAIALLVLPMAQPMPGISYATRTAQTRTLSLVDGSRVFVGARSAVKVNVTARRRDVELQQGEAFFEVAHDPSRPFLVHAGATTIRVVGTKFDVARVGDRVRVSVLQGRVEVVRRSAIPFPGLPASERVIVGGQEVRSSGALKLAMAVAPIGVAEPGAWRGGRLLYADAPLKEVVADANRYSDHPIRLASEDVGDLRVTATFRTSSVPDLIANLDQALPLKAERESDGTILISRDPPR